MIFLEKYTFFQYFESHVLQMASDCAKIAWGPPGSKFWQKSCIFMLDFDAQGPISTDFPMESIILPHPLGVHLRLEIGAPGLPNRRNFARGIRFRGLKLPKRRANAIFFNFGGSARGPGMAPGRDPHGGEALLVTVPLAEGTSTEAVVPGAAVGQDEST